MCVDLSNKLKAVGLCLAKGRLFPDISRAYRGNPHICHFFCFTFVYMTSLSLR